MLGKDSISLVKQVLRGVLGVFGLEVHRRQSSASVAVRDLGTVEGALARLRHRGVTAGTIIDVGASDGRWSQLADKYFSTASFLAFEPLVERSEALTALAQRWNRFDFVAAAAGATPGSLPFVVTSDLDGSGLSPDSPSGRRVDVVTIDDQVALRGLAGPYLIKLDTHGFEVEILEGARQTLQNVSALIIEVYNFKLAPNTLLFDQMCEYLRIRGFRCSDAVDLLRRPGDDVFWQMDLVFEREDSAFFDRATYR